MKDKIADRVNITKCIGILCKSKVEDRFIRMKDAIEYQISQLTDQTPKKPILRIGMACGESVIYESYEDIPLVDTLCSCGDKSHWFIKYEEEKE